MNFDFKAMADPVTGCITNRLTLKQAGRMAESGYLRVSFRGKSYAAHRVAWFLHYGHWPAGEIDHVNRIRDDNRISNLRDVTSAQNHMNKCGRGASGVIGVMRDGPDKSWWAVKIRVNGRRVTVGRFRTVEQAAKARADAEVRYFGKIVSTVGDHL